MTEDAPTTYAKLVINRWGGINPCARALGKPVSTVQRWWDNGVIHSRNWPDIQAAALNEGWFDLTARWLGEAHAAQEVRRAAENIKKDRSDDKLALTGGDA